MTYRKSKSGSEFVVIKNDGFILSIMLFPATNPTSCWIKFTRNELIAEDIKNGDLFAECMKHEFEQAYTRAMKMIEL